jgi:sugar lactone lactonase YvrE
MQHVLPSRRMHYRGGGWDLQTAVPFASVPYSVATEDNAPTGVFFRPDGRRMYVVGNDDNCVYQYVLDTAWDLRTIVYIGYFSVAQATNPLGLFFKPDGTKMYMVGYGSSGVYQYTLSTPWDVLTATYDSVYFSIASQDGYPSGLFFKPDGSRMYMVGYGNKRVYQYSLSIPWNVGTATYDSVYFAVSDGESKDLFFKPDGTKMYVAGDYYNRVYQYTLSTPWNVGTASYDSVYFSVASQDVSPEGIFFTPDGTRMYMIGSSTDCVYQYMLGTPWNIATASYVIGLFDISLDDYIYDIYFKPDGTRMYVAGSGNDRIYQYTLSIPWSVSTATYDDAYYVGTQDTSPTAVFFNPDGTEMYVLGFQRKRVYRYTLSTPWDVSTASYSPGSWFSFSVESIYPLSIFFKSDGTKMYIGGSGIYTGNFGVWQYTLSTPWNITTAVYGGKYDTTPQGNVYGLFFKPDGKRMYTAGPGALEIVCGLVHQYSLSVPWNIVSAFYDDVVLDVSLEDTKPTGLAFKPDGLGMYVSGDYNDCIYQYLLT